MKKYKDHVIPALAAIMMVLFIWPLRINTNATSSGGIVFFASDFILLLFCGYNIIQYFKNFKEYHKNKMIKIVEISFLVLLLMYGIVSAYRLIRGLYVINSFEICFRTLAPLSLALFIFKDKESYKGWVRWINYAFTLINIYSVVLHIGVYKYLRSDFLINVNMVAFLCVIGMFLNSLAFYYSKKNWLHALIFIFNIAYNVTVVCVVGSRAAAFMGVLSLVLSIICFMKGTMIKYYVAAGIVSVIVVSTLWTLNFGGCRYLMLRGFNFTTIAENVKDIFGISDEEDMDSVTGSLPGDNQSDLAEPLPYGTENDTESKLQETEDSVSKVETNISETEDSIFNTENSVSETEDSVLNTVINDSETVNNILDTETVDANSEVAIDNGQGQETAVEDKTTHEIISEGLVENDALRFSFWSAALEEIKKEPIFGTGKVGIAESDYGTQSAHNFILEYCLVYGVAGFIIWAVFIVYYLINVIKAAQKGMLRRIIFGLFGLLCAALGFSFFEVTMITTFGSLIVWIGVFLYSASIMYDDEE